MSRLVLKFGGTSVANIDRIRNSARHVKREVDAGHEVAVTSSSPGVPRPRRCTTPANTTRSSPRASS
jgi:aspartokinase